MNFDFSTLTQHAWSIAVVILFFGGSIFVHELGHFLAAKWRGLHIERFSIGFGPKIASWRRNGVEYRLSWLPLGGYVALPQLADMRGIEGDSSTDINALPPVSFSDKVIVAAAGAVFNMIFALGLATILFFTGRPSNEMRASTEIGYVSATLVDAAGKQHPGPAKIGGIEVGDRVVAIDGEPVEDWDDIQTGIALSSGIENGERVIRFEVERDGERLELPVRPIISQDYKIRQVGLDSGYSIIVTGLFADSPAIAAGMQPGDVLVSLDGVPMRNFQLLRETTKGKAGQPLPLVLDRDGARIETTITPQEVVVWKDGRTETLTGIYDWTTRAELIRQTPFEQMREVIVTTYTNLSALLNRHSDIGISHMSGPAGIIRVIYTAAQHDILFTIWIVVFINVSLAFFNMLPIPVLDGGHIVFALISKLRNKPLNPNLIASVQGSFMLILFSMILYVTFFDISRWVSDTSEVQEIIEQRVAPVFSGAPSSPGAAETE